MHANGLGLKQDFEQAHHWLNKSHHQNNPKAIFNLAVLHDKGKLINSDKNYATELYERARQLGISKSSDIIDKLDLVWIIGQVN